ncbi:MAG: hypothetical protein R8J84_03480 [Mariprofundales bacterium]
MFSPVFAIAAPHVMDGDFIYRLESSAETIAYRVEATNYHGVQAWHIRWQSAGLTADHFMRRDNGAPLYAHRVHHDLQREVEIIYSQHALDPTIYRRRDHGKLLQKQIDQRGLVDLATLPQLLHHQPPTQVWVVNYADGKVYPLKVAAVGISQSAVGNSQVAAMRYRIAVDSWLAIFQRQVQLDIPLASDVAAFTTYSGPDFIGDRPRITLRLARVPAAG